MANVTFTADCGHVIPALPDGHCGGTGYGVDSAGRKHCYQCCSDRERASMVATGCATLYLTRDPKEDGLRSPAYSVTDWPGKLRFPAIGVKVSRRGGGFGSQRTDAWFVGPDGYVWHAINRGDMQIARCKRTREKWVKQAHGGYAAVRERNTRSKEP